MKLILLCLRGVPVLSTDDVSDNSLGSRHSVPSLSPPSPNNVSCFILHLKFNNCTTYYTFSNYSSLSKNEIKLWVITNLIRYWELYAFNAIQGVPNIQIRISKIIFSNKFFFQHRYVYVLSIFSNSFTEVLYWFCK